jgi:hypothetical protein
MTLASILNRTLLGAALAAVIATAAPAQSFSGSGAQPVTRGGSGRAALTQNALIFGNGTAPVGFISPAGNSGLCLKSDGTGWVALYCFSSFLQGGSGAVPVTIDQLWHGAKVLPEMYGAACGLGNDATLGLQRAINYLGSVTGGVVELANCLYRTTDELDLLFKSVSLQGQKAATGNGTEIYFIPPSAGKCAIKIGDGSAITSNVGVRDLTVRSPDTTTYKTGICATDTSVTTFRDVFIYGFVGGASSPVTGAVASPSNEIRLTVANASVLFASGWAAAVSGVVLANSVDPGATNDINSSWPIAVVSGNQIDLKGSVFSDAFVSGGTITASSTGLHLKGREYFAASDVSIVADLAMRVSINPNLSTNSLDQSTFNNMQLQSGGTNCNLMWDDGVVATSPHWTGFQAWVGGKSGWCFRGTTSPAISEQIDFNNVRTEQPSAVGGWIFDVRQSGSPIYSLHINQPLQGDGRDGIRARNVKNLQVDNWQNTTSARCLDLDGSVVNTQINGGVFLGGTATLAGQYLQMASGKAPAVGCLPSFITYNNNASARAQFGGSDFLGTITAVGNIQSGAPGVANGSFAAVGIIDGIVTVSAQPHAGSANLVWPTTGSTLVASAAGLLAIDPVTGQVTCANCASIANPLSQFAATSSAQLRGLLSDETGIGPAVFGTSPNITTPTGIVKGDVGLGNVDNTSDATKWAAVATVTNKVFNCASNTCTVRLGSDVTGTLLAANAPAYSGDVSSTAGSLTLAIGATKVTSAMLNADVFSTAHSWGGPQTLTNPIVGTQAANDNSTKAASTAYADAIAALKANLASPTFIGTPTAPTAAVDTNTTQIATTAMVLAQAASASPSMDGSAAAGTSQRYARGDHVHPTDTSRQATLTPGQLPGATTNDNASVGNIGEIRECNARNASSAATITIASPGVVTWTAHGLSTDGLSPINFTTSGALPTGLTVGTIYWTVPGTIATDTFQLATSIANAIAGTAINTSGTQSGSHVAISVFSLATATATNYCALSLPAGDWDVTGTLGLALGSTTNVTYIVGGVSLGSATLDQTPGRAMILTYGSGTVPGGAASQQFVLPINRVKVPAASTSTVFGIAQVAYTVSTTNVYGSLRARRAR